MLKLIDRNCKWFEFASEELKDDKEVVMKAIEHNGLFISCASKRLRYDESVVLAAVKNNFQVLFVLNDEILINPLIYKTGYIDCGVKINPIESYF